MILITGDSWACGEWDGLGDRRSNISHAGLAEYLRQHGYQVFGFGKGGGSNLESADRVADFMSKENGFAQQVTCVIVFQTEWIRDVVNLWNMNEFEQVNYNYLQLRDRLIARFYHRLSQTAMYCNVPVFVVGGCSDTIWLDQFEKEYPGVKVLCQSWTNLMISNDHRIDQPVLTRFGPETEVLVTFAKSKMNCDSAKDLLHDMDLAQQRNFDWKWIHSQGLLCADRTHPNRKAHKILFDYLIPHISQL